MPEIGDIARGNEVGKKSNMMHTYVDCMDCREGRWIPRYRAARGVDRCFPCNLAYQKATTLRKLYIKHPR